MYHLTTPPSGAISSPYAVAALAPTDLRGSAFGLLATVQSFGNIVASGIAGLLCTLVSPTVAFVYLSVWAAASTLVLVRLARRPMVSAKQS